MTALAAAAMGYLAHHVSPLEEHTAETAVLAMLIAATVSVGFGAALATRRPRTLPDVVVAAPGSGKLHRAQGEDLDFCTALHARTLDHGFFVALGPRFLRSYNASFIDSPHAVALIVTLEGRPVGALTGVLRAGAHRRWMVRHRGLRLAGGVTGALLTRPGPAIRFIRSRTKRYARSWWLHRGNAPELGSMGEEPVAVLSHIAVLPGVRGAGVGTQLVDAFVKRRPPVRRAAGHTRHPRRRRRCGRVLREAGVERSGAARDPRRAPIARVDRPIGRRGGTVIYERITAVLAVVAWALSACGGGEGNGLSTGDDDYSKRPGAAAPASQASERLPPPRPYRPLPEEGYPNGKRLAADIAQRITTYDPGASARDIAARLGPAAVGERALADAIEPAVDGGLTSRGTVIYPQLAGVTPTSLGAMVVVRQELSDEGGEVRPVTRTLDIRLRRSTGRWALDRVGSVGGAESSSGEDPSPAARRVLEHPRITLPDSARWDVLRGGVDTGLLETLAAAAERYRLGVTVISSGHPPHVWATARPSAHSLGYAVDIYEVNGAPVVEQTQEGSAAFDLASELVAAGAAQVGSPWILGAGGSQSFTDDVHRDHIHLQQTPTG